MATLDIELFPRETEGYRFNLSQAQPAVYVLWRHQDEDIAQLPEVFHVTVCPYEAQDYLDGGDVVVEVATLPDLVAHWMRSYIARHHVDEPFEKRRRKRHQTAGEAIEEEEELG
jgi:molybdopterin-guanine dinucleotide biosynthesis protein A